MGKIKAFFRNKWVGFTLATVLYTLWFVVWTGNLWLLLGARIVLASALYFGIMKLTHAHILDECIDYVLKRKR